jgi:hypothetical protein
MSTPVISSTPSSPARIAREIGGMHFTLDADGLSIAGRGAPIRLSVEETLALFDFARSAGARQLVNRAWLAEQHAVVIEASA